MVQMKDTRSQAPCPECDIGPFTRNHYFTGKLLVEADFTGEQHYYMEKMRHHEQRLHGWGVVCGLKVKQHKCPDRFVIIEPGTAIDCCGHEIVVREQESFDLLQTHALKELKKQQDTGEHVLQICVRYKECPIEEIPVLYDDCSCDSTQCAPNRILESYEFDVLLDQLEPPVEVHSPRLEWHCTANVSTPHALRVALQEDAHVFYVMTETKLYQVSALNQTTMAIRDLPAKGLDMAISNDGTRLYIVTEATANPATSKRLLSVLDTTAAFDTANPVYSTDIDNSTGSDVSLVVAPDPDNRLMALMTQTGYVMVWGTDINTTGASPKAPTAVNLQVTNASGLVIASDAKHGYVVAGNSLLAFDLTNLSLAVSTAAITGLPSTATPTALVIISSAGPGGTTSDLLAVADHDHKQLYVVDPKPRPPVVVGVGPVALTYNPIALAASPGGHWVYVVEQDGSTGKSYVQSVNIYKLQQSFTVVPSEAVPVGNYSERPALSKSGRRLYIPYLGNLLSGANDIGTVAILDVTEQSCADLFWRSLDGCPHCETPNCVVLATIEHYKLGNAIEDAPADPTDASQHISRIDNQTGRRLLPSTQVLTEVVECLLENGPGGTGLQGPPGLPGPQGLGIDAVNANIVECHDKGGASIQMIGGQRTLVLDIPRGCDAVLPPPVTYTHICGINWTHGQTITLSEIRKQGLLIAFDGQVHNEDIHAHSFMVLKARSIPQQEDAMVVNCFCDVDIAIEPGVHRGLLRGVTFKEKCNVKSDFTPEQPGATTLVTGAQFLPDPIFVPGVYRVVIHGDYIRDDRDHRDPPEQARAVDANHLPPWLPKRPATGDGVEGGTFVSWFIVTENTAPHRVALNTATIDELKTLPGIGEALARRIINTRAEAPFTRVEDLLRVSGISDVLLHSIRDRITVD